MKFEEVLPSVRQGKRVRRASWGRRRYAYIQNLEIRSAYITVVGEGSSFASCRLADEDILQEDWEVCSDVIITPERRMCWLFAGRTLEVAGKRWRAHEGNLESFDLKERRPCWQVLRGPYGPFGAEQFCAVVEEEK